MLSKMMIDNILCRLLGFLLVILSMYSIGGFYLIKATDSMFYHAFCWIVLFFWNAFFLFFASQYPISVLRKRGCHIYGITCIAISTVIWFFTIILIIYLTVIIPAYQDSIFSRMCGIIISFGLTLTSLYQLCMM